MSSPARFRPAYSHFVVFNFLFLALQFILILRQGGSFIDAIPLPHYVYFELALTLLIHAGLYLLLSFLQSLMLINIIHRSWHYFSLQQWVIIIWTLTVCVLLTANIYFFPLSRFSTLFSPPVSRTVVVYLLISSSATLTLLLINTLFGIYRKTILSCCALLLIYSLNLFHYQDTPINHEKTIILIGIDSLSPKHIHQKNMPNLTRLLQGSTRFADTISPLARTYPAWTSILTGLYPKHHYARYNLIAKNSVKNSASIAWMLDQQNYQTVFATDDRRFNNIDKEMGFQKIIGPKLGVNDVLIGSFNDFPLGNLLINLPLGRWLFPYNHMNRASYFSYYPHSFNANLKREITTLDPKKPLFLAMHFTLPHWPYAWAESLPAEVKDEYSLEEREQLYLTALRRVDQQVADVTNFLDAKGYLKNSLVIFLSDHGETLYIHGSRPTNLHNYQGNKSSALADYFARKTATELDRSAGHGSDLLSPQQYHCLLAFKWYRNGKLINKPHQINTRVSLIDIAPTLYDVVGKRNKENIDGISLLSQLSNPDKRLPERVFYMESGMLPNQALSARKARELGQKMFIINPETGALELKTTELHSLDQLKLYAIISGDWLLALYPDDQRYITVIQQLHSKQWTDDESSRLYQTSKASILLKQLQNFLLH